MRKFVAYDLETYRILAGLLAPPIVCGSTAAVVVPEADEPGEVQVPVAELFDKPQALDALHAILSDEKTTLVGANIAYDFGVIGNAKPEYLKLIFKAYAEGRIHDVQIAQALNAIAEGNLYMDPDTGRSLRNKKGKQERYNLGVCVRLNLGRDDAKDNDFWRQRYALLDGVPHEVWPFEARQYPKDDANNTLEVGLVQLGYPTWVSHERKSAFSNLSDLPAQAETAFAMHLGAVWGIRTSKERVEALEAKTEAWYEKFVERFKKVGFLRENGKEDSAAVKRAVAKAYGADKPCETCKGTGKCRAVKREPCRGVLVKRKYQGCPINKIAAGLSCSACGGAGFVEKVSSSETNCKDCNGSGYDLASAPTLPITPAGGISTSRDTLEESGDADLHDYAANEPAKIRETYLPFLREGVEKPINLRPNILVESGRTSYDGLIQLIPRGGGVRECFVARPGYVFCDVDYAAIELCALAQVCLWLFGESKMAEVINRLQSPGALHTDFAAQMIGTSYEELQAKIKAKDEAAKNYRQAAKCFHPDTEILTRYRGWVKVSELALDDEVASVVPREERPPSAPRQRDSLGRFPPAQAGQHTSDWWRQHGLTTPSMEIVWSKPVRLTKRKATEGLLHIKNESIDLRVTPDHRMLAYGNTKKLLTIEAARFGKQRGWFNAGMYKGGTRVADERLLRLAVATQADGNYLIKGEEQTHIRFGFSKQRKIDRLASMLFPDEYTRSRTSNGKHQPTTTFKLSEALSTQIKALLDADKTFPWWWLEMTAELRAAVLDEAAFWDAHTNGKLKCFLYCTTLPKNADVLQAIASITNRKAQQYVEDSRRENEKPVRKISVKTKYDTRGEHVKVTKLNYDGDVYCLTVPSDCVLVRDGGIPIVTHQCANFGFGGGMGAAKLVFSKRKKSEGMTKGPDGREYIGIRFCILIGGAKECGTEKITEWRGRQTDAPLCRACVEIVDEQLRPAWFEQWPEVSEYHKWVKSTLDQYNGMIPCFGPWAAKGVDDWIHRAHRVRGGVTSFSSGANNGFQALAACGAKNGLRKVVREAYLDPDSHLWGTRIIMFVHDANFGETPEERAHLSGPRMGQVMVEGMREWLPDVFVEASPTLMRYWDKRAEPAYDSTGKLIVWEPKEKK